MTTRPRAKSRYKVSAGSSACQSDGLACASTSAMVGGALVLAFMDVAGACATAAVAHSRAIAIESGGRHRAGIWISVDPTVRGWVRLLSVHLRTASMRAASDGRAQKETVHARIAF